MRPDTIYSEPLSEMSAPVWFTVIFAIVGVFFITSFACRNGVFGECCKVKHHELPPSDRYGIGGHARDEGLDSSKVPTIRAESEEEDAYGDPEGESRRSGGLSADERSETDEDWRGTV